MPFVTDKQGDDAETLDRLERQLEAETEELEQLRHRTRVMEVEVAGWKTPVESAGLIRINKLLTRMLKR
jgi:cell division protein FtsB